MYEIAFHPHIAKDFKGLDKDIRQRILGKVEWLADHVEEMQHEPLTARWAGMYRLRVGDYRVIYGVEPAQRRLTIYAVGHRREVYRLK